MLGFRFNLGGDVMQAAGGGGAPVIPDSLVTNAAFICDFPRGSTIAYTTATGTTPTTDTGFVRSIACEKAPAGAGTRIVRDADEFTFRNNVTDDILGAGVVRELSGTVMGGATGNTTPGDFLATTKWWILWHGRCAGTASDISIELYRSDTNNARMQLFYQPSTGTLRLHVHNGTSGVNYDHTIVNGSVVRFAAYFDGTNLHRWIDDAARADNAGTGGLGAFDNAPRFFRGADDKVIELSALWLGKEDGNDSAQHMADIENWLTVKGAA